MNAVVWERGFCTDEGDMMDKIRVEICCGTACYLLGAAKMMDLEEQLPPACRGRVEIEAKACLGLCEHDRLGGAPYVRVNGAEIIGQATPEKVIARLCELVERVA